MWILTQWKLVLTVSTLCALLLMTSAWRTATAQRDLAIADLASYKQAAEAAATAAKDQSDRAVKEIKHDYDVQKAAIKKNAWANYQKRVGATTCGAGVSGVPMQPGGGSAETGSTEGANAPSGEQLFVEACARDAGRLDLWIQWATLNNLPISKE